MATAVQACSSETVCAQSMYLPDALAASTPGGLEHDGVANALAADERLLQVVDARLPQITPPQDSHEGM